MDPPKAKFLPPPHFLNKATRSPWLIIIHTLAQVQGHHRIAQVTILPYIGSLAGEKERSGRINVPSGSEFETYTQIDQVQVTRLLCASVFPFATRLPPPAPIHSTYVIEKSYELHELISL